MSKPVDVRRCATLLTVFLLALGALLAPGRATAGIPSPANSTWPADGVRVASDTTCCFDVIVRDVGGFPLAGSMVKIDFGSCPVTFCPQQAAGLVVVDNTIKKMTSATGVAHFCICASFTGTCSALLSADGVQLAQLPVDSCGPCMRSALCDTCAGTVSADSVRYGRMDDFYLGDGSEPTAPLGAALLAICQNSRPFDDLECDRCFAHTMLYTLSPGCSIVGGTLRLRLKACGNTSGNDSLTVMHHGVPVWSSPLAPLAPGGHWNNADSMTIVLDLCRMPDSGTWETNLIPYLGDGSLDVYLVDDTGVDYLELTYCVCCGGSLHGTKYNDLNHDGGHQTGELGLPNWTINLSGAASATTTTDVNGSYSFTGLAPGNYSITEANQHGWVNTGSGPALGVALTAGSLTGLDFENWECRPDTCVAPPRCTVAWYPFDETSGTQAHDLANNYTLDFVGSPTWVPAGKVGGAIHFPGGNNYLKRSVPPPLLDFGTGSFSIDAWIHTNSANPCFLDKRVGGPGSYTGYAMTLYNGKLAIQVAAGAWANYYAGPALNDGNWHFVAATVSRTGGPTGTVKLYTDGVLQGTFTTYIVGNVTNAGPLFIGQRNVDGPMTFVGDMDELELMNCCVDSLSLARICAMGPYGKCREDCYISYVAPSLLGHAYPYLMICNHSGTAQSYHWSVAPCSVNGLSFSPNSGTVPVPAGHCLPILLHAVAPGIKVGEFLCFETTVLNDGTGHCFECSGTVTRLLHWWGRNCLLDAVPLNVARPYTLWAYNTDSLSHVLHYRLRDVSSDGDTANAIVRLNDLPPGTPVTGSATIAAGDSVAVPFTAQTDDFQLMIHEIVLSGDLDGNAVYEDICGLPLVTMATVDSTVGVGPAPAPDFTRVLTSPNPFQRVTTVQFSLPVASDVQVDVYDILGRLVRTLQSGRMLAGEHRVEWDGLGSDGAPRSSGVYFVRVKVGAKLLTTKVIQMR